MNIYKLITPVNKYNYVNHPYIKRDLDYYSQHTDNTNNTEEFAFMKRKKLSTTIHGMAYNDDYIKTKINVISNAMKVDIQDRTPLSKRIPEIMQNPYILFGDPNTKYDELLTASPSMLASVEPINYFGCRIVGDYLYNFDIGMIFKIIPKDFLARYIDPTLIKESSVYVDSRSAMIMPQKSAFKNIWIDTKRYIPVNPKYVETVDINSLIKQPIEPVSTVQQPIEQPVERPLTFDEIPPLPFDIPILGQPVIESDNDVLDRQQKQSKRRILDESLNEQQQQPIRRRRKPKMNETTK